MTRTMFKHENVNLPYPKSENWSIRQLQVLFALQEMPNMLLPVKYIDYISYNYGDFCEVIEFTKFFLSYWNCSGKNFDKSNDFHIIDTKFIEWVEIMEFKEFCSILSQNFDHSYKRFMYVASPEK